MSEIVLDTSALLALLNEEAGAEVVEEAVSAGATIGAVNLAEVVTKLAEHGVTEAEISEALQPLSLRVAPFDESLAYATGALRPVTRRFGLSLGDRACLALGVALKAEVLTADRTWEKLGLPVTVRLVR